MYLCLCVGYRDTSESQNYHSLPMLLRQSLTESGMRLVISSHQAPVSLLSLWDTVMGFQVQPAISGVFTSVLGFKLRFSRLHAPFPTWPSLQTFMLFLRQDASVSPSSVGMAGEHNTANCFCHSHCQLFSSSIRVSSIGSLPQP